MKVQLQNRCLTLAAIAALALTTTRGYATIYTWDGSDNSTWSDADNWDANGIGATGGTGSNRLSVYNGANNKLIYDSSLGTTTYTGDSGGNNRGLVVGGGSSNGEMEITGGTFSTAGATAEDVLGAGSGLTGKLTIGGGNYQNSAGLSVGFGFPSSTSQLAVNTGTATISTLTLNPGTSGTATVDLNGGTLTVTTFSNGPSGTRTFNFNGGTLKPTASSGSYMTGLTRANVRDGGAVIDTAFAITIGQALLHSNIGGDNATDGGLTKKGSGALTLSGANDYTGTTSVQVGELVINNDSALGSTSGSTSVTSGASLVLANGRTVTGEQVTINGTGTDFNGALVADTGAAATWAGGVVIGAGGRIGTRPGGILTVSGVIQDGTGNLLNIGAGTGGTGTVIISGASNTYTGATNITRGTVKIGVNNALPTGTTLDIDNSSASETATFDLNDFNQTVAKLQRTGSGSGTGGSVLTNSSGNIRTMTINQSTSTTYDGNITGNLALTKSGGGTLTLSSGSNTYAGVTKISGGTLALSGSGTMSNSLDLDGGTLDLTTKTGGLTLDSLIGNGTISGDKLVAVNVTLGPGHSIGAITHAGDLTLGGSATTTMEIDVAGNSFDKLTVADVLTYGGTLNVPLSNVTTTGTFDIFDFASMSGSFNNGVNISGYNPSLYSAAFDAATGVVSVTAVPEPGTFAMLLFGSLLLWAVRRGRK